MKRFLLLIVFCLVIFQCQVPFAQVKEGWREFSDNEIHFQVPVQWEHKVDPTPDIIHSFSPKGKGDRVIFKVYKRLPGPKILEVEKILKEDYFPRLTAMMKRIIENLNITVIDDRVDLTKIHGINGVDFHFRIKNRLSQEGNIRIVYILTTKVSYIFYCFYLDVEMPEGKKLTDEIISSIRINTDMIPDNIGPKTYEEIVKKVKSTLDKTFTGMPSGWGWQVKSVKVTKTGDNRQIVVSLTLPRPDTQTLIEDHKKVISAYKEGHAPETNELTNKPLVVFEFSSQLLMIAGVVAGGSAIYEKLPIDDIILDVINKQGHKSLTIKVNTQEFLDRIKQGQPDKLYETIQNQ